MFTDYADTARHPQIDVWLCENHYRALMDQEPVLTSWYKDVLAQKQASYH